MQNSETVDKFTIVCRIGYMTLHERPCQCPARDWTAHHVSDMTSRNSLYFGRRRCAALFAADKPIIAEQSTEIYRQFRLSRLPVAADTSEHAAISLTRRDDGSVCFARHGKKYVRRDQTTSDNNRSSPRCRRVYGLSLI